MDPRIIAIVKKYPPLEVARDLCSVDPAEDFLLTVLEELC